MAEKQNTGAGALVSAAQEAATQITKVATWITKVATWITKVATWALKNRPHLVHLAIHAKTRRARKKNAKRILREFMEGRE